MGLLCCAGSADCTVHLHSLSEAQLCGQQTATDAHSLRQVSVLKGHPGPAAHFRHALPTTLVW